MFVSDDSLRTASVRHEAAAEASWPAERGESEHLNLPQRDQFAATIYVQAWAKYQNGSACVDEQKRTFEIVGSLTEAERAAVFEFKTEPIEGNMWSVIQRWYENLTEVFQWRTISIRLHTSSSRSPRKWRRVSTLSGLTPASKKTTRWSEKIF